MLKKKEAGLLGQCVKQLRNSIVGEYYPTYFNIDQTYLYKLTWPNNGTYVRPKCHIIEICDKETGRILEKFFL